MATRINYVRNASFETRLDFWDVYNPSNSVQSYRDLTAPFTAAGDTAKLRIDATAPVDYGRKSQETLSAGTYTAQCAMATLADCTNAAFVVRRKDTGAVLVEQHITEPNVARLKWGTFTLSSTAEVEILLGVGSYGVQSKGSAIFDRVMIEASSTLSPYFDGSTPPEAGYKNAWLGTPYESRSTATSDSSTGTPTTPPSTLSGWTIVDADDFASGTAPNTAKWSQLDTTSVVGAANSLSWAPPPLVDPITIKVTNASRKALLTNSNQDYIVTSTEIIDEQVEISGNYRNVIVKNIEVVQTTDRSTYDVNGDITNGLPNRGLFIKGDGTNTAAARHGVWVEGCRITGPALREGINIDGQNDYGLDVYFQNCIINDDPMGLRGKPGKGFHHADGLQVYNGLRSVNLDRVSILTNMQGFMIQPVSPPQPYTYRRVEVLDGPNGDGTLFYQANGLVTNIIDRVYCTPDPAKSFPEQVLDENSADWAGVKNASMPAEDKVNGKPGLNYVSPGYGSSAPKDPNAWALWADPNISVASIVNNYTGATKAGMEYVRDTPGAKWFGIEWDPNGTGSGEAVKAATAAGKRAVLVWYSIPGRDYGQSSAGGASNEAAYKSWIQTSSAGVATAHAVVLLEPDAIPLSASRSQEEQDARYALMSWAAQYITTNCPNVKLYHDNGHSQWLSSQEMAPKLAKAGVQYCHGIAENISNFRPTADCEAHAEGTLDLLAANHGITGLGYVVDTSRNGAVPAPNPADWQNPPGIALGSPSHYNPAGGVGGRPRKHGNLWVKVPGESDGRGDDGIPSPLGYEPNAGVLWPLQLEDILSRSKIPTTTSVAAPTLLVSNGTLQIRGQGDAAGHIKHAASQTYGRWEVRAKVDAGKGYAPTIKIKGAQASHGTITFVRSTDGRASTDITGYTGTGGSAHHSVPVDLTQWHTFAIEWLPDALTFKIDDLTKWKIATDSKMPNASGPLWLEMYLEKATDHNGIALADSATPQPFLFEIDYVKVYAPASGGGSTPTQTALEQKVRAVWEGIKRRYIRADGAVLQREADSKVVSEGQAYALMVAAQLGDWATFDRVEAFNVNVLERKNYRVGGNQDWRAVGGNWHDPRVLAPNLLAWDYRVNAFGSNPPNTVNDWNFATDGDVDRYKALMWRWYRTGHQPSYDKALQIATQLRNHGFNTVDNKSYQAADEFALADGGVGHHHLDANGNLTTATATTKYTFEMNVSYIDPSMYHLAGAVGNDEFWRTRALPGAWDALTKVSDNASTLATTAGVFPNWNEMIIDSVAATAMPEALTKGVRGWTYSRSTDMTYDAFRTVWRLVWSWDYYRDTQIPTILAPIKSFYASEWTAVSKIAAEYSHTGARLAGGYENNMMTAGAYLALTVNDPANATAAAIKSAKLNPDTLYKTDADGYAYWSSLPDGSSSWAYYSDFWLQFFFLREAGLWVNWGQQTNPTGATTVEITDRGWSADLLELTDTFGLAITDVGTGSDSLDVTLDYSLTLLDAGTSTDQLELTIDGQPTTAAAPPPVITAPGFDRWVWVAPDGQTIDLTRFTEGYAVTKGMTGRYAPPVVIQRDEIPSRAGAITRNVRHGVREMAVPLWAQAPDWEALQALLGRLIRYMDPVAGEGTMRFIGRDGRVSELGCRCVAGLSIDGEGQLGPANHKLLAIFQADDPYWYGEWTTVGFSGSTAENWFNILPLSLGSSAVLGDVVIDTDSDVETWPIWTVVGPGAEPKLINHTTGRSLSFRADTQLSSTEKIVIDTRPGVKTALGSDGSNWRKFLVQRSLWPLAKGRNEVTLAMNNTTGESYISVAYRRRSLMP